MKRLIKKYPNRKLYDAIEKKYVTLRYLEQYLKRGTKLQVIDTQTHEDITNVTLAQIALSMAKKGRLPRNFFDSVIKFTRHSV